MLGAADVTFETNEQNIIEGAATFSACVGRQNLVYRWTLPAGVSTAGIELGYPVLVLPENSLPAGMNSQFVLEAWAVDSPANIGQTSVTVRTNYPALLCLISGGSGERSTLEPLVLDGSASKDPAGLPTTVEWSCRKDGLDCVSATGAPIVAVNQSTFGLSHVDANTIQPDTTQTWTATIRDAVGNAATRTKSCQVTYSMFGKAVLTVKVQTPENANYVATQFISGTVDGQGYDFIANVESKLQLSCSTVTSTDQDIAFAWNLPEGLALPTVVTDSKQLSTGGYEKSSSVVFEPSAFSQNVISSMNCTATGATAEGTSTGSILGNDAPSGGSCSISPTTGSRVKQVRVASA